MIEIKAQIEDIASSYHQQVDNCTTVAQVLDCTQTYVNHLSHKVLKNPLQQSVDQFMAVYR